MAYKRVNQPKCEVSDELRRRVTSVLKLIEQDGLKDDYYKALYEYGRYIIYKEFDVKYGLWAISECKKACEKAMTSTGGNWYLLDKYGQDNNLRFKVLEVFYDCCLVEAKNGNFESYLIYLEKNRPYKDRFYMPKSKQFKKIGLIQALQDMLDDKLDLLCLSLPPGTGKTTLSKFFISYVMGLYPKDFSLFFSHSADICRMYYDGVLSIITSSEYTWSEIFPDCKVTSTNANAMKININNYKPFQNLMCGSRGSDLAGKVRCNKFLMIDDLIGKQEEALNKNTLDKIWNNDYTTDALQRKIEGCKEIHIATRWSVWDVIGRLKMAFGDSDRARFIAVPDIDPETDESNFDYEFEGFSKEFFEKQALLMDDVTNRALYKNEPVEREGLLYKEDILRHYQTMPDTEPDAILGVCDTKAKGVDYMVLPVFYQYGNDFYLVDCLCDNTSDFDYQYSRITSLIVSNNMQKVEFESNAGGDRIAHEVAERLRKDNSRCVITTKATESNKETRIIVNSDWVIKHCLFKDKEDITPKSDYWRFMNQMLTFSVTGKNKNDDVVDALANFSLFVDNLYSRREIKITRGIL